jgi:hypothetical protein
MIDILYVLVATVGGMVTLFAVAYLAYLAYNAMAKPGAKLRMSQGVQTEMKENLIRVLIGLPLGVGCVILVSQGAPVLIVLPAACVLGVISNFVIKQTMEQVTQPS